MPSKRGLRRVGVSSPTGSGKTTVFTHLIPLIPDRLPAPVLAQNGKTPSVRHLEWASTVSEEGQADDQSDEHLVTRNKGEIARTKRHRGQTLILVGKVELVNQAERQARRILGSDWSIEVEQAARHASGKADATIATYSTLCKAERLAKFDPSNFKLVIVDEAHHAAATSYLRILNYFNTSVRVPPSVEPFPFHTSKPQALIVGFSATFSRADDLPLNSAFEEIVFHMDTRQLIASGHLSPAKLTVVKTDLDLTGVETDKDGEFRNNSLANRMNTQQVNDVVVRAYSERAEQDQRRSTVVFCVNLSHVQAVTNALRKAGVDARSITSASSPTERGGIITAFGKGEFPVLVNCEILTEGTDIPEIDCIVLARPTTNRNLLIQMVGRGLRLSPKTGKKNCLLIDIEDSVARADGMRVSPTLLGLDLTELDEKTKRSAEPRLSSSKAEPSYREFAKDQ
ncbi:hypothetical protein IAU59_001534 [Kwoniella sp. CBS 9459]